MKIKKIISGISLWSILLNIANAQTIDSIVNNFLDMRYLDGMSAVFAGFGYLSGIGCLIKAALKVKESVETKGQVKLAVALYYFLGGAALLGLTTMLVIGKQTFGMTGSNY